MLACLWLLSRALARAGAVAVYVAPQRAQAKRIAFELLRNNAPPGTEVNQSELMLRLPNDTRIYLLGTDSDNGDSIRGLGIVAAVLDEVADISPYAYEAVIRPALADHQGDGLFIGTPKGKVGLFWRLWQDAEELPGWHRASYRWDQTDALDRGEVEAMRREMNEADFRQELECSWSASIKGAYWAKELDQLEQDGRLTEVPHDPGLPVYISMDLGYSDATSCWAWQFSPGGQVRALWFREWQNTALPQIVSEIRSEGSRWNIAGWIMPHDAKVHELGSGRTRAGIMQELGCELLMAPNQRVRDGIEAVRALIPRLWIDRSCADGLELIKQYRSAYDEKRQVFNLAPLHDFTSHAADSIRYMATSMAEGLTGRSKPDYHKFASRMI